MRLLLPTHDRARTAYGIKEATLAKLYINVLGISDASGDGERLLNWRIPEVGKQAAGDFAGICALVMRNRCPPKGRYEDRFFFVTTSL